MAKAKAMKRHRLGTYVLTLIRWFKMFYIKCDNFSRAETIQGRKLLIIRRFWLWKLFKGGNYSRAETICRNTVFWFLLPTSKNQNNQKVPVIKVVLLKTKWQLQFLMAPCTVWVRKYEHYKSFIFDRWPKLYFKF